MRPGASDAFWALADFDYSGAVDDTDVTLLGALYNPTPTPPPSFPSSAWERTNAKLRFADPPQDAEDLISLLAASIAADAKVEPPLVPKLRLGTH